MSTPPSDVNATNPASEPARSYRSNYSNLEDRAGREDDCAICPMELDSETDTLVTHVECNNALHAECIEEYLQHVLDSESDPTCPWCQGQLQLSGQYHYSVFVGHFLRVLYVTVDTQQLPDIPELRGDPWGVLRASLIRAANNGEDWMALLSEVRINLEAEQVMGNEASWDLYHLYARNIDLELHAWDGDDYDTDSENE